MSHIAQIELAITNLDALERACATLGLELIRNQKSFNWYNSRSMDRAGWERAQKCEHVIRRKGAAQGDYEIGLVPRGDGKGFEPIYDNFGTGQKLEAACGGAGLPGLKQHYGVEVSKGQLQRQGYRIQVKNMDDGSIRLIARK